MATLGFTYYDTPPTPSVPTIQELIDALSGAQKTAILDGFTQKILPKKLSYDIPGLSRRVIQRLYEAIDSIEEMARSLMRGEVLITPAVIDPETGEITTAAVYNTPPTSASELLSDVEDAFIDVFTSTQVEAVLTRMVEYSKHDGSGDWTYYSANVIL